MKISSNFDSGNIEVLSINNGHAELNIRKDTNSDFLQWFHFRATDVLGLNCRFELKNAGQTTYPDGWKTMKLVHPMIARNGLECPLLLKMAHSPLTTLQITIAFTSPTLRPILMSSIRTWCMKLSCLHFAHLK